MEEGAPSRGRGRGKKKKTLWEPCQTDLGAPQWLDGREVSLMMQITDSLLTLQPKFDTADHHVLLSSMFQTPVRFDSPVLQPLTLLSPPLCCSPNHTAASILAHARPVD